MEATAPNLPLKEGPEMAVMNHHAIGEGSSSREADMEVESILGFKTENFDNLLQVRRSYEAEMDGVSDGGNGELRTKERSDSTNYQSGAHQRPIALN